jgi:hypothetical protein
MSALLCDQVGPGMRPDERTVALKDLQGRREFLRVPFGYLVPVGDAYYVPVGLVYEDTAQQVALIELPQEGECGNWRLWVRTADLLQPNGKPA